MKFDQIRLFLLDKHSRPQIDILSLNETFLKSSIPDSLYSVQGFSVYRRDRKDKNGGGVMIYINDELNHRRRTDLESVDVEAIWIDIYPYKSNRSALVAGIYRPPSYTREQDDILERNIETAYLLNKETLLLGDFNINHHDSSSFKKHRLIRAISNMNFKQLVNHTTRPISGTCLDHVYSNYPQRIANITINDSGMSDHSPVRGYFLMCLTENPFCFLCACACIVFFCLGFCSSNNVSRILRLVLALIIASRSHAWELKKAKNIENHKRDEYSCRHIEGCSQEPVGAHKFYSMSI